MKREDRGLAVSVEAAILLPALILFIALIITTARVALAQQALDGVAAQAARAATLERSVAEGRSQAEEVVSAGLREQGLACLSSRVSIDAAALGAPLGATGDVDVSVACVISFGDVALPNVPGSIRLTGHATSSVDRYRHR